MSFNCSAQISVASASRSGQRAPTGVAVPPAGGVGRAAARSASSCTFRRHGRLGLQPVGRGQVRLHPRYARRGFPGARRRSASSLGPTGRDPRGARRLPPPSPALHGPLSSGGRGPGRGARRLLSQRSSSWRAARHEPWPGWGALQPGERAGDALGSAAGRLGETGAGYGVGDHPGSSTRPASMSLLHPTPAQQHLPILSVPVPGLSSEPFLNLPQKEQWGISLASRDFPGDSRPMKQNFPPGTVGLVL